MKYGEKISHGRKFLPLAVHDILWTVWQSVRACTNYEISGVPGSCCLLGDCSKPFVLHWWPWTTFSDLLSNSWTSCCDGETCVCVEMCSMWTWELVVISFFASIAGLILLATFAYFACLKQYKWHTCKHLSTSGSISCSTNAHCVMSTVSCTKLLRLKLDSSVYW